MKNYVAVGAAAIIAGLAIGGGIGVTEHLTNDNSPSVISKTFSAGECGKNFCWTCNGPVNLDSLYVNVDTNAVRVDGVKFTNKCTGEINQMTVITQAADGVKVAAAHDLMISQGSVQCLSKLPGLHQDGVQVLGGQHVHFTNMTIDCGRYGESLINSNFFISTSGTSTETTDDVICDTCYFGPYAGSTVSIQASTNSGVSNSTICPGKYFTLRVGKDAANYIHANNTQPTAC